jgi:phosphomethylpyrimidine synthase
LPFPEDVREGVIASRIAAHVGDMVKHKNMHADKEMSKARRNMQWDRQFSLAIDPERAREIKAKRGNGDEHSCTMCGKFCANDILRGMFESDMADSDKR